MLSRCAVPSRFVNAAPACSALLRSVRVPFRAAPRAIQQGNGRPWPAAGSCASATDELHVELLARYEKAVSVRYIHCCGSAKGPDPSRGMADALGGGRRRSSRCGSTSPPPAPHAGCKCSAWTDQACVEHHDEARDRPFWFNTTTGESVWEKPAVAQAAVPAAAAAVESAQPAEATQATTSVSGGAE